MSSNAPKPPPPPPPRKPAAPPPRAAVARAPESTALAESAAHIAEESAVSANEAFATNDALEAFGENPFEAVGSNVPSVPPAPAPLAESAPEPVYAAPARREYDLGEFAAPLANVGLEVSDDEAVRKIRKHTSKAGKAVAGVITLVVAGLGTGAYVQQQRYDHRFDRVEEIGRIDDRAQMLAGLREELAAARHSDVKQRIMRNLGHFRDAEAVPVLIAQLANAGAVRRDAARALAEIGLPAAESAKQPLLDALPKTDAKDRAQVAWTLAVLHESRAADTILELFAAGRLQSLDGFDPKTIVDVVGPERLASPALTNAPQSAIRVLTAHALSEVANASVVAPLASMIDTELARPADQQNEEVIRSAAAGLGRTGAREASRPLFNVLTTQRGLRQGVLEALGRAAAAPQLAVLLGEASTTDIKKELARLLSATHDPRGADALAALLGDADRDVRSIAATGLAQLGDRRAMPVLLELARITDNETVRRQAFLSLRLVSSAASTRDLEALLRDVPASKTDVLRALGKSGDPAAASILLRELESDDPQAAALGLGDLNESGSFQTVLRKAPRPTRTDMSALTSADRNPANEVILGNRRATIVALGRFGRDAAVDTLSQIVEDSKDDFELRALAAASIGQVATDDQIRVVLAKVKDASLPVASREYYVQSLWQRPRPALNGALMDILEGQSSPELKRAAGLAIGFSALPDNDARLVPLLEREDTRRAAAFAIALGGGEEAVEKLRAKLAADADLREVFRDGVTNDDVHWFDVLTQQMFDSGAIYRRIRAAWQLKQGAANDVHSYVWERLVTSFEQGYEGPGGVTVPWLREKLWTAISSGDENARLTSARMLVAMEEYGILLRARDAGGDAERTARVIFAEEAATTAHP